MSKGITFYYEKYKDILDDLKIILPAFFAEVDIYPESPEPNIDHDQFTSLDEAGKLQVVTAREDGKLVGFHISMVLNDIFYKHILTAYVCFYYLKPESRGKGNGASMFAFADNGFKDLSVERIFMSRKIYMKNEKLFDSLDYTKIEETYTKFIGEDNGKL